MKTDMQKKLRSMMVYRNMKIATLLEKSGVSNYRFRKGDFSCAEIVRLARTLGASAWVVLSFEDGSVVKRKMTCEEEGVPFSAENLSKVFGGSAGITFVFDDDGMEF